MHSSLAFSTQPAGQTTLEEATRLTPQLEDAYAKKSPADFNDDLQRLYLMGLMAGRVEAPLDRALP
jgi:hypothetical protein